MSTISEKRVRVRFAPSPTGYLHVGGARTALYNYLFARHNDGDFVFRVEDTDQARSTEDSMRMQIADLHWLGLKWDEGIDPITLKDNGPHGPYRQSQRLEIYKKHALQLVDQGKAYYCFMTDEEIEAQKSAQGAEASHYQAVSPYRNLSKEQALEKLAKGEKASIRFKVEGVRSEYTFTDLVRGEMKFPSDMVSDFVILRSTGMPVYNFCCAVDDALMKITHVLRGEEHLSNTLRQLMLFEAFGYEPPQYGHLSIILGQDRQKLSKRHGATSCNEYRERGYLPEALNNFIGLLGWSSPKGQEILSMQEMIDQFSLDRINPASAVFDDVKLKWVNATHLRALPSEIVWKHIQPFLTKEGITVPSSVEWQNHSVEVFKPYLETFEDAIRLYRPLSDDLFKVESEGAEALQWEKTPQVLNTWIQLLEEMSSEHLTEQDVSSLQNKIKEMCDVKGKFLFMPIRVAVIGKPHGTELKELVPLMYRESLIKRAKLCLQQIK